MNSVQESKQELEAAIRYAENAISSAKQTIESMMFRQEMAKKQSSEQTGREQALQAQVKLLEERIADMSSDMVADAATIKKLRDEKEASSGPCGCQAYRDIEEGREMLEKNVKYLRDENERLKAEVNALEQPEVEELKKQVEFYKEAYTELEVANGKGVPTMPVIPKAVAIAIFREGIQHGVESACTELDNAADISIEENEYCGDFEVSFSKYIDLSDHLDTDWMRDKCGDYSEETIIDALGNLCADKEFECRIHGVDDQEEKKND